MVGAQSRRGQPGDLSGSTELRGDQHLGSLVGRSPVAFGDGGGHHYGEQQIGLAFDVVDDSDNGERLVADEEGGTGLQRGDSEPLRDAGTDDGDRLLGPGGVVVVDPAFREGGRGRLQDAGGSGEDSDPLSVTGPRRTDRCGAYALVAVEPNRPVHACVPDAA